MAIFFCLLLILTVSAASESVARADDEAAVIGAGPVVADIGLSAADVKVYRAAFTAVEEERWEAARELAALARNPLPAKVIQWLDLTRLGADASFDELAAFLEANPHWPERAILEEQAERAMPNGLPPEVVLRWFGDRAPRTVEGSIQRNRAMIAVGLKAEAIRPIRRDWVQLDMGARDEATFLALFGAYLLPQDHIARLDRLLWDRQVGAARRMLDRVDAGHRALADARLRLMTRRTGLDAAIDRVPAELVRDPGLVYERARWRRRHGRADAVIELLDQPLADTIARPDLFWIETRHAARRALDLGHASTAYRLAKRHGATEGLTFAEGEWLAGWIALRFLDDPKAAYVHFTRLYAGVSSSISRGRGAYWAGRAAEALGDDALARNWYEAAADNLTSFYGQLAAHQLGRNPTMRFRPLPEPTKAQRDAFAARELVRVVRMLGMLDELDRARPFILQLADLAETPVEHAMIAELAIRLGRDDLAVLAAKEARRTGVELVDYLYPLQGLPDGVAIEDALVFAVMRQESAFAPDALSSAGARGLMQLMPATARQVARRVGLSYSQARLTADPEFNIQLGSAYLDMLLNRFDGSYLLAIAAYNAGPARVAQWLRAHGDPRDYGVDPIDWIEAIPFSETRNYVQRVLENLQVYRHRLGEPLLAFSLIQDVNGRGGY